MAMDDDGLDLHDLFSIKDYKNEIILLPRYCSLSNRNEEELKLELLHSIAATTDPDLTGQVLWPVSRLLSYYIASDRIDLKGKTVLELGAGGTALPSITAAHCGASSVVATDGNDGAVFDLLRRNVDNQKRLLNFTQQHISAIDSNAVIESGTSVVPPDQASLPPLSFRQLLWGSRSHIQALRKDNQSRPFDVILAADVVQWPAVVEPLLHTVVAAMWCDDAMRLAQSVFILGIVERSTAVYDQFFTLARTMGFKSRAIDSKEYFSDGSIPPACQERGGRCTKLFELTLHRRSNDVPLLLMQNLTEDYIVGRSFEQTVFLPC